MKRRSATGRQGRARPRARRNAVVSSACISGEAAPSPHPSTVRSSTPSPAFLDDGTNELVAAGVEVADLDLDVLFACQRSQVKMTHRLHHHERAGSTFTGTDCVKLIGCRASWDWVMEMPPELSRWRGESIIGSTYSGSRDTRIWYGPAGYFFRIVTVHSLTTPQSVSKALRERSMWLAAQPGQVSLRTTSRQPLALQSSISCRRGRP